MSLLESCSMHPPRERAYIALVEALKGSSFVHQSLTDPFARRLAIGVLQNKLLLHHYAKQLVAPNRMPKKLKERILIYMALYQHLYMDSVPTYAIAQEMVELAKAHTYRQFAPFLNAVLRKLEAFSPDSPAELCVRYSHPEPFVKSLTQHFGLEQTEEILRLGNEPAQIFCRHRLTQDVIKVADIGDVKDAADLYIQNPTQVELVKWLAKQTPTPSTILDLCASPGGKLIMAHDLYPHAALSANDVSEEKGQRLKENLSKYGIDARVRIGSGQSYPEDETFDLVICDVPCSNSGVFNKRPEARWRFETWTQLATIQLDIIRHAQKLVNKDGTLWILTCSILPEENEALLPGAKSHLILPDRSGRDGGFAAIDCRKKDFAVHLKGNG